MPTSLPSSFFMTYDFKLEKPYYWNEDQERSHTDKTLTGIKTEKIVHKKYKSEKLPSLKIYNQSYGEKSKYKTPWTGWGDYVKQCKQSEKSND